MKQKLTIQELIQRGAGRRAQRISKDELESLRVAFWDIEASDLNADAGVILCGGVKTLGKKGVRIYRIDNHPDYQKRPWDDSAVAAQLREDLESHDVVVHHYGDRYDIPFLNTRLIGARKRILDSSRMAFVDTWLNIRKRLKLHSNRLASLIDHLDTKVHKTGLDLRLWLMASMTHGPSLKKVVEHNIADIDALEEVTMELIRYYDLRYTYVK